MTSNPDWLPQFPILALWERIIAELTWMQDEGLKRGNGLLFNPVIGVPCIQDTTCAAEVFAVEHARTGSGEWKRRSSWAREALTVDAYAGIGEPVWSPAGVYYNRGSLYMTGTVLETIWETAGIVGESVHDDDKWYRLGDYLETCRHVKGGFAHDTIPPGVHVCDVQNTTAIALYLIAVASGFNAFDKRSIGIRPDLALDHLCAGQRSDGLWPYIYPGWFQKHVVYRCDFLSSVFPRFRRIVYYFLKDRSVFYGDSAHHCYVMYYLLRAAENGLMLTGRHMEILRRGWRWIEGRFVRISDSSIRFDFGWEPQPTVHRFCNYADTTTYFLIMAMIPLIESVLGLSATGLAEGLALHVKNALLRTEESPCILPYEGSETAVRHILPSFIHSVSWKGALLARYLRYMAKREGTLE